MDDKTKKEYFKKFIIDPLSDSLPFTQIFSNFDDNLFTENPSSFAEYINFDLGELNAKEKKASVRKSKLKGEANIAENLPDQVDLTVLENLFEGSDINLNLNNNNDTNLLNDVFLIQDNNNYFIPNDLVEVDLEYLNKLVENYTFKNPYLKLDNEINWKIDLPNFNTNKNSFKNKNSQSQNHAKMCGEAVINFYLFINFSIFNSTNTSRKS